jgi:uncharacterized protein (TIGR00725 family)
VSGRPPYVAVIGSGVPEPERDAQAEAVGRELARRGAVLVCGGLGGVMDAACRGANRAGGTTVGLLPGSDRAGASSHLAVALPTGMGELRNGLIVRAADAVVAVGGEYGTLAEIGFALKLGRPVVGLGTWELRREGRAVDAVVTASDAAGAVERALALSAERRGSGRWSGSG